jgi:hypothetical protein
LWLKNVFVGVEIQTPEIHEPSLRHLPMRENCVMKKFSFPVGGPNKDPAQHNHNHLRASVVNALALIHLPGFGNNFQFNNRPGTIYFNWCWQVDFE